MIDNKRVNEEEYQFPSYEYVGHGEEHEHVDSEAEGQYVPVTPKTQFNFSSQLSMIKEKLMARKRIVATVGIAVVVLVAFNIMRPHHSVQVISQTPVTQTPQVSNNTPMSALSPQPVASTLQQDMSSSKGLTDLQSADVAHQAQIDQLRNQVASLSDSLQRLQATQTALVNSMAGLNDQVKQLAAHSAVKKEGVAATPFLTQYHVRAVIPGRAWLEDTRGQSVTISVGDRLNGYGQINDIDAQQGIVLTSSGKTIKFSD